MTSGGDLNWQIACQDHSSSLVAGLSYSVFSDSVGLASGISWFPRKGDFVESVGDQPARKNRNGNGSPPRPRSFMSRMKDPPEVAGCQVALAAAAFRIAWGTLWLGQATR